MAERLKELNRYALDRAKQYVNLRVAKTEVRTPFYCHEVGMYIGQAMTEAGIDPADITGFFTVFNDQDKVSWGWYRGKGTPEQIAQATEEIAKRWSLDISEAPPEVIVEVMKYAGLGVDCSGFIYNVLNFAFSKWGAEKKFKQSLDWIDEKQDPFKAGVFVFVGKASNIISVADSRELDLILIRKPDIVPAKQIYHIFKLETLKV
ncbi:MAG: hypothetical protein ABH867_01380 [Patescibacteria group bacterium]|nr:hypothetical protein [Patescibacteria group bacterium]